MKTEILDDPREAAQILLAGGLVAFPTETVFGLAVDATDEVAIGKLFAAKGRPSDNPLIVHIGQLDDWPQAARQLPEAATVFLQHFAPGPITVVVPKALQVSPLVTAGLDTVGVRIPAHQLARQFLRHAACPVAAPSANLSGRPSCTTWQAVLEDMDGRIDAVLRSEPSGVGIESTVVSCIEEPPQLLRSGGISLEALRSVYATTCDYTDNYSGTAKSPGLNHPHYQPLARVMLTHSPVDLPPDLVAEEAAYFGMDAPPENLQFAFTCIFENIESYAQQFYEMLREADRRHLSLVIIQTVPPTGIGQALRDRQKRSAAPKPQG